MNNVDKNKLNYEELQVENIDLKNENTQLKEENENLKLEIASLKKMVFGPRSEKMTKDLDVEYVDGSSQMCMLDEITEPKEKEEIEKNIEEVVVHKKKKSKTKK